MIKNEKQYRISKSWVKKFEDAIFEAKQLPKNPKQPWLRRGQIESLQVQLDDLQVEIKEYEALKTGKVKLTPLDAVSALPVLLIKWRIANNWTQKELSERLGLAEQQIQKYENTNYSTATLETLTRIAIALKEGISHRLSF
jgi:DNA-binding Xre family transcriptional regulator